MASTKDMRRADLGELIYELLRFLFEFRLANLEPRRSDPLRRPAQEHQ